MIDVYGMSSPNVLKVTIMLEETALAYRPHYVNMFSGDQHSPDFVKLSPLGKVPAILDAEGPGGLPHAVFESGAILLYLAEKSGSLLPREARARSVALQWLMVQLTTVGPMFGQFVHFVRAAPPGNEYSVDRYRSQAKRVLASLEARLGESSHLGGPEYGLADIATWPWIRTASQIFPFLAASADRPVLGDYPNIRRWFEVVGARPAVERGTRAGERFLEEDQKAFTSADADALDRFFERGRWAR